MINKGFTLSVSDIEKLEDIKQSEVFSYYVKAINSSPIYKKIVKTHIDTINIGQNIEELKMIKAVPDDITTDGIKALNTVFQYSIYRLLSGFIAEVILLKEIEDINIDNVINDIKKDENILYILGLAPDNYYEEAQRLFDAGKIDKDNVMFKGLLEYKKRSLREENIAPIKTKKKTSTKVSDTPKVAPKISNIKDVLKGPKSAPDLNSDDIRL